MGAASAPTGRAPGMSGAKQCWRTNKRSYASKAQARRAMRKTGRRLFVYSCPFCGAYHMTKGAQQWA